MSQQQGKTLVTLLLHSPNGCVPAARGTAVDESICDGRGCSTHLLRKLLHIVGMSCAFDLLD